MTWPVWTTDAVGRLARIGLDLHGVADGARYQHVLPGCRAVLVLGSGGPGLWDAFVADLAASPDHLSGEDHPLDAFVRRALDQADPDPLRPGRRWIRCAADEPDPVDFRTLAAEAGLGWPSALGLLLHPTRGPWLGLRAACFTVEPLPVTGRLRAPGPCVDCAAPCASACPASAIALPWRPGRSSGMQVAVCAGWNAATDACRSSCRAREACPIGSSHRYSPLEVHYHQDRGSGRRALAARLGIADRRRGLGPDWSAWAAPGSGAGHV